MNRANYTADLLEAPNDSALTWRAALNQLSYERSASPEVSRFLGEWEWLSTTFHKV
jgi:hypothetical protein